MKNSRSGLEGLNYKYFLIATYDWTGKIFYPFSNIFPTLIATAGG